MADLAGDPLFSGGSLLARVMADHDWAATPVGPPSTWSPALRNVVGILLSSRFSMWVGWGPELAFFYNDAYQHDTLQAKHPWALGRPAREVWAEVWDEVEPRIESVLRTGVATWDEDLRLVLERSGSPEETYHTFSYSPLRDESDAVAGFLCVVTETTERVLAARRTATLRDLATALTAQRSTSEVTEVTARTLAANPLDVPFALLYLHDGAGPPVLARSVGLPTDHPAAALSTWIPDGIPTARAVLVDRLDAAFPDLPSGPWDHPTRQAAVVGLGTRGDSPDAPRDVLVVGLNPLRPWDDAYRGFVELAANQIVSALVGVRAYQAQRRRAEELAALDRAKTTFFSNTSHEFRTPLTLMLGPLEELRAAPAIAGDPQLLRDVEMVHRNGLRLQKLVNNLLEFSRIEAGRIDARFEPVDLVGLTAELTAMFDAAARRAGLDLRLESTPLDGPVWVDRTMWEKVVLNLLSNAVKFTLEGGIRVRLGPHPDGSAAGIVLEIADTGVGVPPDELNRLFERFHQVPGARGRSAEGSGIGLALIKELVELHGGRVEVTSTVGTGTTFRVWLPSGSAHLPPEQVVDHPTAPAACSSDLAAPYVAEVLRWLPEHPDLPDPVQDRTHVLVVDDNADMRDYVARLLSADHRVTAAATGTEALVAARADVPDLVVSDVMLPGIDGFQLLAKLRADPTTSAVPVLLLSARAGQESALDGLAAGADDYLVKPFSAVELRARVAARIELTRLRRNTERWFSNMADAVPTMIWIDGPGAKRVLANAAWSRFVGEEPPGGTRSLRALGAAIGTGWQDRIHPDDRERYAAVRTEAEDRRTPFEIEYRLRRDDGRYRWVLDRGAPFTLEDGSSGFVGGCLDIDDRQRDRERQRLLAVVGTVLDLATTLDHRRQLLVRTLVDEGLVDTARLIAFDRPGDVTSGRPVAAAATTEGMERLLEQLDPWWFPDDPAIPELGRAGPFDDAMIAGRDPDPRQQEMRRQLRDLGLHSHSVVPLRTRGQTIGLLTGGRAGTAPAFDDTDLALMTEISERAATALDNVALLERERATSRRLAVLQAATGDLSAAATPADVAAVAVTQFSALLDARMVAVWELRGGDPATLAVSGFPDELWGSTPLLVDELVRGGQRIWVAGRAAWEARSAEEAELVARCGVATMGGVPLRVGDHVVGAVVIGYSDEQRLDDDRASAVQALADQCAQALDRAGLLAAESLARRQAEESGALVAALSLTESPAQVAAVIVEACLAMGAAAAAVVMADGEGLRVLSAPGRPTDRSLRLAPGSPHPLAEVVRTGTPIWRAGATGADGAESSLPGQVAIPLALAGSVVGAFAFSFAEPVELEPAARAALLVRAELYAQALDRARLRETEHEVAEVLQRSLLPGRLPDLDDIDSVARYRPGALNTQAGGDFYDVLELDERHVALVIGDVVGHGPRAAAVMGRLSAAATGYLLDGRSPAATLERVDRFASRQPAAMGSTCICLTLDRETGEIVWAGAGHPPLMLVEPEGSSFLEHGSGVVLGVRGRRPYAQASRRIAPGSVLVAYTDGLVERRGEVIDVGLERLRGIVEARRHRPVEDIADAVLEELVGENAPGDDVAFVVLRWLPAPARTTVPALPGSLAEIRRLIDSWSTTAGLPTHQVTDLQLAIGEAVTNAIEHAYHDAEPGRIELELARERSRGVRAVVRDHGHWRVPAPGVRPGGLGLVVVRRIAEEVTVHPGESGTTVSFLVPATARPSR
ncbi:SpoIIE family protein phosphatase [Pseudonocardia thermophila]|mgnify:CR=1 FL=1|uniref:SpoIIE family protein phosphatase n=1 Tax=Pseudonocardia thermophila TaxID=1848 RepID=UPI00248EC1AE|nr:SpoIIE family protein phosphatase [Pseudonocardia thermophila]